MRFSAPGKMFNRLWLAAMDKIGNTEFGDGAERTAEGGADQDSGEVFRFTLGHCAPVRIT